MAPGLVTPEKAARGKLPDRRLVAHDRARRPAGRRPATRRRSPRASCGASCRRRARPGDWVLDFFAGSGTTGRGRRRRSGGGSCSSTQNPEAIDGDALRAYPGTPALTLRLAHARPRRYRMLADRHGRRARPREHARFPGRPSCCSSGATQGTPFLVLTNNSIFTPRDLSARLRASGLDRARGGASGPRRSRPPTSCTVADARRQRVRDRRGGPHDGPARGRLHHDRDRPRLRRRRRDPQLLVRGDHQGDPLHRGRARASSRRTPMRPARSPTACCRPRARSPRSSRRRPARSPTSSASRTR